MDSTADATKGSTPAWIIGLSALVLLALGAGCSSPPQVITLPTATNAPKRLATVFISPTPNAAEQQATRLVTTPTVDPFRPTATTAITPTVYVGFFLGNSANNVPLIDPNIGDIQPTSTRVPSRCDIEPDVAVLGDSWRTNAQVARQLGCPIEGFLPFVGTSQVFENGVMYRRSSGQTWAMTLGSPGRYWFVEIMPDPAPEEIPAQPGLYPPANSILGMWQQVDGVRQTLGLGLLPELELDMGFQRFEGGTLLFDGETGQVYALLIDGQVFGPYSAAESIIRPD